MKCIIIYALLTFFIIPNDISAQIISTVAGGGVGSDGNPATAVSINNPNSLVFDKSGNLYFSENLNHKVRKISITGIISTVAGTGIAGFSGDGSLAIGAQLNQPNGIALDSIGNIFIADGQNNRIRRIDAVTGVISTIIGNGVAGFSGDNYLATTAILNRPSCIVFNKSGELFIGDYGNNRIRKVNKLGIISTVVGNGLLGWAGDGGPATNANCGTGLSIVVDNIGRLLVADWGNYVIRMIDTAGIISTIAGDTSSYVYIGDNINALSARLVPTYIAVNSFNDLFISDYYNNRIYKVNEFGEFTTIAGNGLDLYTGDGYDATLASISRPSGITFDSCDNLLLGQVHNPRIRKVSFNPDCIPTSVKDVSTYHDVFVKLYPNPTNSNVTVEGKGIRSVAIWNVVGQVMSEQVYKKTDKVTVDISNLPPGVYMIRVNDAWVGKVVKE